MPMPLFEIAVPAFSIARMVNEGKRGFWREKIELLDPEKAQALHFKILLKPKDKMDAKI